MASATRRIKNFLISIDQLTWVIITLGAGNPDETISSAAYRYERMGYRWGRWARKTIDFIFFWEPEHCRLSYESEIYRLQHVIKLVDARNLISSKIKGEAARERAIKNSKKR